MRALTKVWVLVVDVGLGEGRLVSKNSIVWESRGRAVTLVLQGLSRLRSVPACHDGILFLVRRGTN